jgi:hypothetical protein
MLKERYYQEMEPGVRDIVRALNTYGVDTIMSCEGHDKQDGGLFPHSWYVEISPSTYSTQEQQLKKLCRLLPHGSLRMIIDPTKRHKDRFFIVGRWMTQEEVVKAIHSVGG